MENVINSINCEQLMKLNHTMLVLPVRDMIEIHEENSEIKELAMQLWNSMQQKVSENPVFKSKIQNIYNSIRHGIDKKKASSLKKKRKSFAKDSSHAKRLKVV